MPDLQKQNKDSKPAGTEENIKVFVRIRPLSSKETNMGIKDITLCNYEQNVLALQKGATQSKTFQFDGIFGPNSDQAVVYRTVALPVVEQVLQGYNGCIFAYGQTGTGKTYTMSGVDLENPESKGIIPNTFSHIFTYIAKASEEKVFIVRVTFLEIYNEEVRDLLSNDRTKKLQIKERTDIGIYVKDLVGFTVDSVESITKLLNRGNKNRVTKSTMMNDVSSRSHAIFTITIECEDQVAEKTTVGKLNLVDLAGSERQNRTLAAGERLREASSINMSLLTLSQVIATLSEGKSNTIPPFRNSKLTRLLSDSLGGNSKTSMIAMLSPAETDFDETICTLRYAARAKHVTNVAKINVNSQGGMIVGFQKERDMLLARHEELKQLEEKILAKKQKSEKNQELEQENARILKEKQELEIKLNNVNKKLIVGGENLIDKVEQQEFSLLMFGEEIKKLDKSHQLLEEQLSKKAEEKVDIEEKYSSLQEEDTALTKNIRVHQGLIKETKEERADKDQEYQREMENLIDTNRLLNREIQLSQLTIDSYIPSEYQAKIKQNLVFNPETQEFQIRGVAYTGNNMRKRRISRSDLNVPVIYEMKNPYHKYPDKKRGDKPREKRSIVVPRTR